MPAYRVPILILVLLALSACTVVKAATTPSLQDEIVGKWDYSDGSTASAPSLGWTGTKQVEFFRDGTVT